MSWKCPGCGTELDDALTGHEIEKGGCGYVRIPKGVQISSDVTGKGLKVHISTTLGQSTLKSLNSGESRFLSEEQFRIEKASDRGGWTLAHFSYATNSTFLNGRAIPDGGALLADGDRISIKDKYFRLTVRLLN